MFLINNCIFQNVKCFTTKQLCKGITNFTIICFRGLGGGITCGVPHNWIWSSWQKVWINYCSICQERFVLEQSLFVIEAYHSISRHLSASPKCSWYENLWNRGQFAEIFTRSEERRVGKECRSRWM